MAQKMMYIVGRKTFKGNEDMRSFETEDQAEVHASLIKADGWVPYIRYGKSPFYKDRIE